MGNRQTRKAPGRQVPALVFLPIDDHQPKFLFSPQPSWWAICQSWLRYHSIQLRWDIERKLARLLRKRWGS